MSIGLLTIMEMKLKIKAICDSCLKSNFILERSLISRELRKVTEYLNKTEKLILSMSELKN